MRFEVHVHTKYSKDSILCFWPLYIICRIKHIDGIAITEHNNIEGAVEFKKFCQKHGDKINVIIGDEIFTTQGEIIGLFLKEPVSPGMSVGATIRAIKEQGGIVYVPHPYDPNRNKTVLDIEAIVEYRGDIDCMEVHNGRNVDKACSVIQNDIAEKCDIKKVVGSDAHTLLEVGRNYMELNEIPQNADEFHKQIRIASFHTMNCIVLSHSITKCTKAIKLIFGGRFHELYRAFIK